MEEVAYYLSLEQSPAGGLKYSHNQWITILKTGNTDCVGNFPVPPDVQERAIEWLLRVSTLLSLEKKEIVQDTIDARLGRRKEKEATDKGEGGSNSGGSVRP